MLQVTLLYLVCWPNSFCDHGGKRVGVSPCHWGKGTNWRRPRFSMLQYLVVSCLLHTVWQNSVCDVAGAVRFCAATVDRAFGDGAVGGRQRHDVFYRVRYVRCMVC